MKVELDRPNPKCINSASTVPQHCKFEVILGGNVEMKLNRKKSEKNGSSRNRTHSI